MSKNKRKKTNRIVPQELIEMIWKMIVSLISRNKTQPEPDNLEELAEELSLDYFRSFLFDIHRPFDTIPPRCITKNHG